MEPDGGKPSSSKEATVAAPCLVALTAKSILVFNFSGRVVTNCNRILDDIVDIAVKGAQSGHLVMVRTEEAKTESVLKGSSNATYFRTGEKV